MIQVTVDERPGKTKLCDSLTSFFQDINLLSNLHDNIFTFLMEREGTLSAVIDIQKNMI